MRISDWSSDVCSSDLIAPAPGRPADGHDDRSQEEIIAAQGAVIPTVPLSRSRKRAKGEGLLILQERLQPRAFVPMGASQKLAAEAAPAGRPSADPPSKPMIITAIPDPA